MSILLLIGLSDTSIYAPNSLASATTAGQFVIVVPGHTKQNLSLITREVNINMQLYFQLRLH